MPKISPQNARPGNPPAGKPKAPRKPPAAGKPGANTSKVKGKPAGGKPSKSPKITIELGDGGPDIQGMGDDAIPQGEGGAPEAPTEPPPGEFHGDAKHDAARSKVEELHKLLLAVKPHLDDHHIKVWNKVTQQARDVHRAPTPENIKWLSQRVKAFESWVREHRHESTDDHDDHFHRHTKDHTSNPSKSKPKADKGKSPPKGGSSPKKEKGGKKDATYGKPPEAAVDPRRGSQGGKSKKKPKGAAGGKQDAFRKGPGNPPSGVTLEKAFHPGTSAIPFGTPLRYVSDPNSHGKRWEIPPTEETKTKRKALRGAGFDWDKGNQVWYLKNPAALKSSGKWDRFTPKGQDAADAWAEALYKPQQTSQVTPPPLAPTAPTPTPDPTVGEAHDPAAPPTADLLAKLNNVDATQWGDLWVKNPGHGGMSWGQKTAIKQHIKDAIHEKFAGNPLLEHTWAMMESQIQTEAAHSFLAKIGVVTAPLTEAQKNVKGAPGQTMPPGAGWEPTPNPKKGKVSFRKHVGAKKGHKGSNYIYWYPEEQHKETTWSETPDEHHHGTFEPVSMARNTFQAAVQAGGTLAEAMWASVEAAIRGKHTQASPKQLADLIGKMKTADPGKAWDALAQDGVLKKPALSEEQKLHAAKAAMPETLPEPANAAQGAAYALLKDLDIGDSVVITGQEQVKGGYYNKTWRPDTHAAQGVPMKLASVKPHGPGLRYTFETSPESVAGEAKGKRSIDVSTRETGFFHDPGSGHNSKSNYIRTEDNSKKRLIGLERFHAVTPKSQPADQVRRTLQYLRQGDEITLDGQYGRRTVTALDGIVVKHPVGMAMKATVLETYTHDPDEAHTGIMRVKLADGTITTVYDDPEGVRVEGLRLSRMLAVQAITPGARLPDPLTATTEEWIRLWGVKGTTKHDKQTAKDPLPLDVYNALIKRLEHAYQTAHPRMTAATVRTKIKGFLKRKQAGAHAALAAAGIITPGGQHHLAIDPTKIEPRVERTGGWHTRVESLKEGDRIAFDAKHMKFKEAVPALTVLDVRHNPNTGNIDLINLKTKGGGRHRLQIVRKADGKISAVQWRGEKSGGHSVTTYRGDVSDLKITHRDGAKFKAATAAVGIEDLPAGHTRDNAQAFADLKTGDTFRIQGTSGGAPLETLTVKSAEPYKGAWQVTAETSVGSRIVFTSNVRDPAHILWAGPTERGHVTGNFVAATKAVVAGAAATSAAAVDAGPKVDITTADEAGTINSTLFMLDKGSRVKLVVRRPNGTPEEHDWIVLAEPEEQDDGWTTVNLVHPQTGNVYAFRSSETEAVLTGPDGHYGTVKDFDHYEEDGTIPKKLTQPQDVMTPASETMTGGVTAEPAAPVEEVSPFDALTGFKAWMAQQGAHAVVALHGAGTGEADRKASLEASVGLPLVGVGSERAVFAMGDAVIKLAVSTSGGRDANQREAALWKQAKGTPLADYLVPVLTSAANGEWLRMASATTPAEPRDLSGAGKKFYDIKPANWGTHDGKAKLLDYSLYGEPEAVVEPEPDVTPTFSAAKAPEGTRVKVTSGSYAGTVFRAQGINASDKHTRTWFAEGGPSTAPFPASYIQGMENAGHVEHLTSQVSEPVAPEPTTFEALQAHAHLTSGTLGQAKANAEALDGPFRAPHSGTSALQMIPEVGKAKGGVLYFDALNAFAPSVLRNVKEHLDILPESKRPIVMWSQSSTTDIGTQQFARNVAILKGEPEPKVTPPAAPKEAAPTPEPVAPPTPVTPAPTPVAPVAPQPAASAAGGLTAGEKTTQAKILPGGLSVGAWLAGVWPHKDTFLANALMDRPDWVTHEQVAALQNMGLLDVNQGTIFFNIGNMSGLQNIVNDEKAKAEAESAEADNPFGFDDDYFTQVAKVKASKEAKQAADEADPTRRKVADLKSGTWMMNNNDQLVQIVGKTASKKLYRRWNKSKGALNTTRKAWSQRSNHNTDIYGTIPTAADFTHWGVPKALWPASLKAPKPAAPESIFDQPSVNQVAQAMGDTSANESKKQKAQEAKVRKAWRTYVYDNDKNPTTAELAALTGLPAHYVEFVAGVAGYDLAEPAPATISAKVKFAAKLALSNRTMWDKVWDSGAQETKDAVLQAVHDTITDAGHSEEKAGAVVTLIATTPQSETAWQLVQKLKSAAKPAAAPQATPAPEPTPTPAPAPPVAPEAPVAPAAAPAPDVASPAATTAATGPQVIKDRAGRKDVFHVGESASAGVKHAVQTIANYVRSPGKGQALWAALAPAFDNATDFTSLHGSGWDEGSTTTERPYEALGQQLADAAESKSGPLWEAALEAASTKSKPYEAAAVAMLAFGATLFANKKPKRSAGRVMDEATKIDAGSLDPASVGKKRKAKTAEEAEGTLVTQAAKLPKVTGDPDPVLAKHGVGKVNFGRGVPKDRRPAIKRAIAQAMNDLSDMIGVKNLWGGGNLRLSVQPDAKQMASMGAKATYMRGSYSHGEPTITFAKEGHGSFGHELGHALDNYLAQLGGKPSSGMFTTAMKAGAAHDADSPGRKAAIMAALPAGLQADPVVELLNVLSDSHDKLQVFPGGMADYLKKPVEIFARAFDQWAGWKAQQQGNKPNALLHGANDIAKWSAQYPESGVVAEGPMVAVVGKKMDAFLEWAASAGHLAKALARLFDNLRKA